MAEVGDLPRDEAGLIEVAVGLRADPRLNEELGALLGRSSGISDREGESISGSRLSAGES